MSRPPHPEHHHPEHHDKVSGHREQHNPAVDGGWALTRLAISATGDGQSIAFTGSGADYSIDLSKTNADKYEKAIGPYLTNAQRVGGRKSRSSGSSTSAGPGRYQGGPRLSPHPTASSSQTAAGCPPTS